MNYHIYWQDKYTIRNKPPKDAIPLSVGKDAVDIICQYFNAKYGEGEMIQFWILADETEDKKWAYREGTLMNILEEYHTKIEPVIFPREDSTEVEYITSS